MNCDHPDSLEANLLVKHLRELKGGHAIQSPYTTSPNTIALTRALGSATSGNCHRMQLLLAGIVASGNPSGTVFDFISMKIEGILGYGAEK